MRKIAIFLIAGVSFLPPVSVAKECKWYEIGCSVEKSADILRLGIDEASDDIYATFNYWAKLIEDYHTGDEAAMKKAKTIVQKVFGVQDLKADPNPFQVRLEIRGVDTSVNPFRVAILLDYNKMEGGITQVIEQGVRSDFNFVDIRGVYPPQPTELEQYVKDLSSVEQEIASSLDLTTRSLSGQPRNTYGRNDPNLLWSCQNLQSLVVERCQTHNRQLYANEVASAVMKLADDKIQLRSERGVHSVPWNGHKYITIVVPEADLDAQPNLELSLTIHATPSEALVLPQFVNNPLEISVDRLRNIQTIRSNYPDHGGRYVAITREIF